MIHNNNKLLAFNFTHNHETDKLELGDSYELGLCVLKI